MGILPYRGIVCRIPDAAVRGHGEHLLDRALRLVPELNQIRQIIPGRGCPGKGGRLGRSIVWITSRDQVVGEWQCWTGQLAALRDI